MRYPSPGLLIRAALAAAFILIAAVLGSQPAPPERVGPLPGGGFLLSSGWKIDPAGNQVALDTFPMSSALSPDGKYLLVLNGGYKPPTISVIELDPARVVNSVRVQDGWLGLAFAPKSNKLYVGGGSRAAVFEFTFENGTLTPGRTLSMLAEGQQRTARDFIGDVAFSPDGKLMLAADLYHDSVLAVNPATGQVQARYKTGRRPYRILFHPDGQSFFVTHWADGSAGHYDASSGSLLATLRLGAHPTDMVWRQGGPSEPSGDEPPYVGRLFVAASNTNNVYSVTVTASKILKVAEVINVAMTPFHPLGMTPSALSVSSDNKTLYVACSDANAVAVVDVSEDKSIVDGFIPTGWYPTAVRALSSGGLVVLNGKGVKSYPILNGPNPTRRSGSVQAGESEPEYVASKQTGTASFIHPFDAAQLDVWTKATLANSPYDDAKLQQASPMPPVEHIVYIVKENRTYDQVLGDMKEGNGDANLVLFGENVTPNLHKLARQFVLLDNFYVNSDVSADGHNWSTAAIAPDYVQKMWPNSYAGRRSTYDYEEGDPAAIPPAGYLWTNASSAGLSVRNFGYMVDNMPARDVKPGGDQVSAIHDPVLAKVTNKGYRGFDLDYPDVERAKVFLAELADYEKTGSMPRLIVMRMGNDHTSGTSAGKIAPLAAAADNDYAVGMIAEGVSKSPFWTSTAIFVLEDDAQNGPDHVDSHRSPAYVISPYVRHHLVDSSMYNTTSFLRTMEFMLGLRPMTHFDAGARPLTAAFQATPDPEPYTAEKPRIDLQQKNPPNAPRAAESARMNFEEADMMDDDELNDILWRAIRTDPPPPPVRSFFGK